MRGLPKAKTTFGGRAPAQPGKLIEARYIGLTIEGAGQGAQAGRRTAGHDPARRWSAHIAIASPLLVHPSPHVLPVPFAKEIQLGVIAQWARSLLNDGGI